MLKNLQKKEIKIVTTPLPIINKGGCNLSLAGLKTDVLRKSKNIKSNQDRYDLAASFSRKINKILVKKN